MHLQDIGLTVLRHTPIKAGNIRTHLTYVKIYQGLDFKTEVSKTAADSMWSERQRQIYSGKQKKVENESIPFDEYIGSIARKDWKERRILLPSVVVAQAVKESGWGTSELAQNAKALFGIKQNGWKGKTYRKTATEQKSDGSIYKVENTVWRAYDNWEQSVIDHNDYIATRSTDGGKTLRYAEIIGCADYKIEFFLNSVYISKSISFLLDDRSR